MSRRFTYTRYMGARRVIDADSVDFTPTHVVFRDDQDRIVLAEEARQVGELQEDRS